MTTARAAHLGGWLHEFSRAVDAARSQWTPGLLRSALCDAYDSRDATLHPYARLLKTDVDRLQASLESSTQPDVFPTCTRVVREVGRCPLRLEQLRQRLGSTSPRAGGTAG